MVINSRKLRWTGHVVRKEEGKSAFNILASTLAEKRPLGRPRRRCEDNIRMTLKIVSVSIIIRTRKWVDSA